LEAERELLVSGDGVDAEDLVVGAPDVQGVTGGKAVDARHGRLLRHRWGCAHRILTADPGAFQQGKPKPLRAAGPLELSRRRDLLRGFPRPRTRRAGPRAADEQPRYPEQDRV